MTASKDETKIAVSIGHVLIKEEYLITDIAVYLRNEDDGRFELEQARKFPYEDACKQFCFDNTNNQVLLFFCQDEVSKFEYLSNFPVKETYYEYHNSLTEVPKFGVFSPN